MVLQDSDRRSHGTWPKRSVGGGLPLLVCGGGRSSRCIARGDKPEDVVMNFWNWSKRFASSKSLVWQRSLPAFTSPLWTQKARQERR